MSRRGGMQVAALGAIALLVTLLSGCSDSGDDVRAAGPAATASDEVDVGAEADCRADPAGLTATVAALATTPFSSQVDPAEPRSLAQFIERGAYATVVSGPIESVQRVEGGATDNLGVSKRGAPTIGWDGYLVTVAGRMGPYEIPFVTAVGGPDVLAAQRGTADIKIDALVGACAVVLVDGASSDPLSVGRPILLAVGSDAASAPVAVHPELRELVEQRSTFEQLAMEARSETARG